MTNRQIPQGMKVLTPEGPGIVLGKDLPESRAWRWMVRMDQAGEKRCFFDKEIAIKEDRNAK